MYSGFLRSSSSVIGRIEVCGTAALERCAAAQLRNSTGARTTRRTSPGARGGGEHPRKLSGLAVAKIQPEARSHAENALEQFRQRSRLTEVRYRTPCIEECSSELLAGLDGQSRKAEFPPIQA